MPDLLEEFAEQEINELLTSLPLERRLRGASVNDLLAALTPESRSAPTERILPAKKRLEGLSVDELLAALTPETRAALAQRLQSADQTKPEKRASGGAAN